MKYKLLIPALASTFVLLPIYLMFNSVTTALIFFVESVNVVIVFFIPFWGIQLYLAALYLRPQEYVAALRAQPIMLSISILVLVTLLLHNVLRRKSFSILNFRQGIFMLAFLIVIPFSQLSRFYLTGAKEAFNDFLPIWVMFFMIVNLVTDLNKLKQTFNLLLFMTLFLAANGIYQHFTGMDIAGQTMIEGRIRWIGIFEDPNDLGLTILAFTPFAILSIIKKKTRFIFRILWTLVLAVFICALYFTNSRGTFIGLMAVFGYLLAKRWGGVKGLACGAIFGLALLVVGPSRMSTVSLAEASASGRLDAWAVGLNLLKWRPILGIGYSSFTEHHHLTAHNSVVLCMAELGVVGLFVWLLLIYTSYKETLMVEKRAPKTDFALYAEALQLSLVGFFTSAFFLSRTYNEILYIILGLCVCLSLFAQKKFKYSIMTLPKNTVFIVIAAEIGFIVMIKIMVTL